MSRSSQQQLQQQQHRTHVSVGGQRQKNRSSSHSRSKDMAEKKAILFNFWGVVASSTHHAVFHKLEELHKLPGGFLSAVMSQKDSAVSRAERGKMTLSQMIPAFQEECLKEAQVRAVTLPSDWSVRCLLDEFREAMMDVQPAVLKTAASLRQSGLLTAVLANHWLDDRASSDSPARLLSLLGGHFDLVLQSCRSGHRVPEPSMFSCALQDLGVKPQQALWLDADEEGVRAAEGAGMKAILVENLDDALGKLVDFTGVKAVGAKSPPPSCSPDQVSHGYVTIKPGVRTHFVEMGSGPPVLLCHGFPESWYSWSNFGDGSRELLWEPKGRHFKSYMDQSTERGLVAGEVPVHLLSTAEVPLSKIPAVAAAGFRVLALDMKGYGESIAPPDIEEYSQEQICKDLITFLDKMSIPQVTLVGHDWGGALVWNMAQFYPERIRAVASLNTPLFPADPSVPPAEKLKAVPIFDYQLYFQKPGVAEAELEKDLERTFKIFFFTSAEQAERPALSTAGVCARGGLLVGQPEQVPRSSMLTEADLQYYVSQYKERGFRGPLNWYRNSEATWKWQCSRPTGKLLMPALMVTAGKDPVLLPAFSKGMEELIPNLSRGHIEECGHWIQMEQPAETNNILISWLKETHKKAGGVTVTPKL